MKNGKIFMKLTSFKENIPIFIMFKALGVECEQVKTIIFLKVKTLSKKSRKSFN